MIDIMNGRREGSDLCWILKDYESKISFFNNYKSKQMLKHSILESINFKYDLKLIADKSGKSETDLSKEACSILDGMSHNIGMNSIRFMGYTLSKIIKQIYQHLFVNAEQMEKLRSSFTNSHVVLLPTHRSYADFLLISYVMFHFNLPMPVIAAAIDFMNMKLVGELLRSCGAFFIRRSFANDDLYWAVFSNYIKALVKLAQEPLEFFIEGTRSRTNKSLFPKIGMLGIVLELWLSHYSDVTVVPISISYDRVLEEKLYAWELLGVPKPKESTSGLLKVRHILNEKFGNIYFNIGNPISISQLAEAHGITRMQHNLQLRFKPALFDNEKRFLRHFGNLIVASQQQCLVVSDWSILVAILLNVGIIHDRLVGVAELVDLYVAMATLLTSLGATLGSIITPTQPVKTVTKEIAENAVNNSLLLHKYCMVERDNMIGLFGCQGDLYKDISIDSNAPIDGLIVDRIHLGNCRNPLLFHVARESILLNRIKHGCSTNINDISHDFCLAIELLSREFIYCQSEHENFNTTLDRLRSSKLLIDPLQVNCDHICHGFMESVIHVHMLAYCIYGYIFTTKDLLKLTGIDKCKYSQTMVIGALKSHGFLAHAYLEICSLDIIRNCISSFTDILRNKSIMELSRHLTSLENCMPMELRNHFSIIRRNIIDNQ